MQSSAWAVLGEGRISIVDTIARDKIIFLSIFEFINLLKSNEYIEYGKGVLL
jgi:hypothetical protein